MHIPVMAEQIKNLVESLPNLSTALDCTFGAGGHSKILLDLGLKVHGLDQDPHVQIYADELLQTYDNFSFQQKNFAKMDGKYDLVLADLGISTMQLESHRGFSFMTDSPLNMAMNNDNNHLIELINRAPVKTLTHIIKTHGQEPWAHKIARNIDLYRLHSKIQTTLQLRMAIGIDKFPVLARVFQAFRIYINKEMECLGEFLQKLPHTGSNAFIISFHSLEDQMVKAITREFPHNYLFLPTPAEIQLNPKSRSAKLRVLTQQFLKL